MLRAAGHTTAMIGTIEYHLAGRVLPAVNTTPESLDLMRLFAELERAGGTHVTMEVSSHALALGRVYGLQFPHRGVHQSDARSPGFPRQHGSVLRSQAAAVRGRGRAAAAFAVLNRDDEYGATHSAFDPQHAGRSGTAWGRMPACARGTSLRAFRGCVRGAVRQDSASPSNRR